MGSSSANTAHGSRTLLVFWGLSAILGLGVAALACAMSAEVASATLLGSPATQVVAGVASGVTVLGVVVAWPISVSARTRWWVAWLQVVAAGVTAMLAVDFLTSGKYAAAGVLLVQSTVFAAAIAFRIARAAKALANPAAGTP
ncbi:hypothetical protein WEI85_05865 [Actinomycetes bacterium KLBMP 9797]